METESKLDNCPDISKNGVESQENTFTEKKSGSENENINSVISQTGNSQLTLESLHIKKEKPDNVSLLEDESSDEIDISKPNEVQMESCPECTFKTKRKCDLKRHLSIHSKIFRFDSEENVDSCSECDFKTKYKFSLKRHLSAHSDASLWAPREEIKMEYCPECNFKTRYKSGLKKHLWTHAKSSLRYNPKEVQVESCTECSYKTNHKFTLKQHMLKHSTDSIESNKTNLPTEIDLLKPFECHICDYRTKKFSHLKAHLVVHVGPDGVQMESCSECSFKTKHKTSLRRHWMRRHANSRVAVHSYSYQVECDPNSNVEMVNDEILVDSNEQLENIKSEPICNLECGTESLGVKQEKTNHLSEDVRSDKNFILENLKTENVSSPEHVEDLCIKDEELNKILSVGEDSELASTEDLGETDLSKPFKCSECFYSTKQLHHLKRHRLVHLAPEEVQMVTCYECGFQTKHKTSLRRHLVSHSKASRDNPDKSQFESCPQCDFKTKHKASLKRHFLRHSKAFLQYGLGAVHAESWGSSL